VKFPYTDKLTYNKAMKRHLRLRAKIFTEPNLLLTSPWTQFRFFAVVPEHLTLATVPNGLVFLLILNVYLFWVLNIFRVISGFTPRPLLFLNRPHVRFPTPQRKYRQSYLCNQPWRPTGLWDVEAPTFSRHSVHRWRWGCQPYALAALYPQEDSWCSFLLEAESTAGP
jgi:hypothetical protein